MKIENLTFEQVQNHFARTPCVIIPLGGTEPFGAVGVLGTECAAVDRVAERLSNMTNMLIAPTVNFACSAPFVSFDGAAGVKPRTFVNMLCEIIGVYVFQGVCKIVLINAAPFNVEPVAEVIARLKKKFSHVEIILLDINSFENVGREKFGFDRNDAVLLSLAGKSFCGDDESICDNKSLEKLSIKQTDEGLKDTKEISTQYKTWRKRGRDPQKLKKLFPNALFTVKTSLANINGDIFEGITQKFYEMMTTKVALSIGSNLGDCEKNIDVMTDELSEILSNVKTSPTMETAPVGVSDEQPNYMNKIIVGHYAGTLASLFAACMNIEQKLGRVRDADKPKTARTADVDILLYGNFAGDYIVDETNTLTIPHRELLNRRFCVEGLRECDSKIVIPKIGAIEKVDTSKLVDQKIKILQGL